MSDMSSIAAFRKHSSEDLAKLAESHFQHDLNDNDKQLLMKAASKAQTWALAGSVVGIGLGTLLALRVRSNRNKMFKAFRASERPTAVIFASGRQETIPDITNVIKPTPLGDIAAYTFFSIGGLLLFGEIGFMTGVWSAKRTISQDPESRARIEKAFRSFRVDVLKKQIEGLERGNQEGTSDSLLFE